MKTSPPVITIDGPGGTGKGTISQLLARDLGWHYLDSGAVYRVLAYAAKQQEIALDDTYSLAKLATHLNINFFTEEKITVPRILLNNQDITDTIRTEQYGNLASKIGASMQVRQALLERQRAFRQWPGLVTDGRDMGTVIFPDAPLKIFLEASIEERARRRYLQLKEKAINVSLGALYDELKERDLRDKERPVAPLKPAEDAIIIDTTHISIDEVLQAIKNQARKFS